MALSYSSLIASKTTDDSIKLWVNDSTIPSTTILQMAEQEIYRHLRVREMKTRVSGVFTVSADFVALPAGYRDPIYLNYADSNSTDEIKHKLEADVQAAYTYDQNDARVENRPTIFYADGTNLNFDYPAKEAYPYQFLYYKEPDALSLSNETNFLTNKHPWMLLSACLWSANMFLRNDSDIKYYHDLMMKQIRDAKVEDAMSEGRNLDLPITAE